MAKVVKYSDIPLDNLVIGKGQVRTQQPGKEIEDLARSIQAQGLLQPIVVCAAKEEGRWEILAGQRRFLAHRYLQKESIPAAILDERVDEGQAKAISITENLIRRKLSGKELKDGILYLYNLYGSIKDISDATGLPYKHVSNYVKYPRLIKELKQMVDDELIHINAALRAQDASNDAEGVPNTEVAIHLAKEMNTMSDVQCKRVVKEHEEHPEMPAAELIERAKTSSKVVQIIAKVSANVHAAVQQFAKEEGTNQDDAAATLIEEALVGRGLLES